MPIVAKRAKPVIQRPSQRKVILRRRQPIPTQKVAKPKATS
jgi:hypothetical protein